MKKADINEIAARIKTEAISRFIIKGGTNYVAWVDGDEERWVSAIGTTSEEAKANLIEQITEKIEMEED